MDLCVTIKGVSFLLQTGLGILGNAVVLMAYVHIAHGDDHKLLPTDLILCHLAFSNLMLLLTRCVPQTMTVFGLHDLLDDAGCKVVIYLYRITRALSVCLTCMLSVFQAATLAPNAPRLKAMLPILHRHSRQVRAMRRGGAQGVETRAAKTVVTLVVLYVVFFGIDNVIWIYMLTVAKVSPVVADMRVFFSSSYAFLSPYFIISSNKKIKGKLVCAVEQDQSLAETQTSNEK